MLYRYKIKPRSPLITPLMSDTFFGHFCWALLYQEGEEFLLNFLSSFENGNPAQVIFSSAFLTGHLPRPTLPSLKMEKVRKFIEKKYGNGRQEMFEGFSNIKKWRKRRFITLEQWSNLNRNYSEEKVYEYFKAEKQTEEEQFLKIEVTASNIISRISGTVPHEGGGLFQREKIWYYVGTELDIYVEVNDKEIEPFVRWFFLDYLPKNGFGADKSTGMGSLSIDIDESFNPDAFEVENPNARLSLSLASFPSIETYDAFYRLKTKFGKLGGNFAFSSPTGGNPKPFKNPILMYEPGAVFLCSESLSDKRLLDNVHSDNRIRHCGVPITLPFNLREVESYANAAA